MRAIHYLDAIEQAFRRIVALPQIGAFRTEVSVVLRSLPVGEHRVYYRVKPESILIVRVSHKAMDEYRHL